MTLTPIESPNTAGNPTCFNSCPANKPAGSPAKLMALSINAILEIRDDFSCELVMSAMNAQHRATTPGNSPNKAAKELPRHIKITLESK